MTSPAITIHPDATLPAAARLMNSRHLKRLPVVDAGGGGFGGNLVGIVSRCDLLSASSAPTRTSPGRSARCSPRSCSRTRRASQTVRNGIVTLAGHSGPPSRMT